MFLGSALLAVMVSASAGEASSTVRLRVVVTGFRSDRGQAGVTVFNSHEGFPEDADQAVRRAWLPVRQGRAEVVFDGLPAGRYALLALHDENANGRFDKNFLGIPKEGYAVSNGARRALAPPKFEKALVTVDAEHDMVELAIGY